MWKCSCWSEKSWLTFFFPQVKPLAQAEAPHGHFNQARDQNASNPASIEHHHVQNSPSITKPLPPPVALKPTSVPRGPRGLLDSPVKDREPPEKSPEDPSQKSFLGKLKAFEKMDQSARVQRLLELQQAQEARVMSMSDSVWNTFDVKKIELKDEKLTILCFLVGDCSEAPRHLCRPHKIPETGPQQTTAYWVRVLFPLRSKKCFHDPKKETCLGTEALSLIQWQQSVREA